MKKTVQIALFTAFIYVLGLIPNIQLSFIAVPIVLQNMGIFLAGSIIGVSGGISVLLFLFLTALGLPMLAGGRGGFMVFFGPTAGYLLGYIFAAFFIGYFTQRFWRNYSYFLSISFNIFGMLMIYSLGIPVYSIVTDVSPLLVLTANAVFIPLDLVKVVLSSVIAIQFKKYYPLIELEILSKKEEKKETDKKKMKKLGSKGVVDHYKDDDGHSKKMTREEKRKQKKDLKTQQKSQKKSLKQQRKALKKERKTNKKKSDDN